MKRLLLPVALLALAGCETLHTGTKGAEVQAQAVVRVVYGQLPDSAVGSLPFRGLDIPSTVKRIRDRFPQVKPFLERGVIGMGSEGRVRERDAAGLPKEGHTALERLIRAENNDRDLLYRALSRETGHEDESDWIAYVGETFAAEWIGQAPAGWWYQDQQRRWAQTPAASSAK